MKGLIRLSLGNPRAITVLMLTVFLAGAAALATIPADILPVYKSPSVQVLTFYGGMSATNVEADITARMERWVGQAAGTRRQELLAALTQYLQPDGKGGWVVEIQKGSVFRGANGQSYARLPGK